MSVEFSEERKISPRQTIDYYGVIISFYVIAFLLLLGSMFFPSSPNINSSLYTIILLSIINLLLYRYESLILTFPAVDKNKNDEVSTALVNGYKINECKKKFSKEEKKGSFDLETIVVAIYFFSGIIGVVLYEMNYVDIDIYFHMSTFIVLLINFFALLILKLLNKINNNFQNALDNTIVFTFYFLKFYLVGWIFLLLFLFVAEGG